MIEDKEDDVDAIGPISLYTERKKEQSNDPFEKIVSNTMITKSFVSADGSAGSKQAIDPSDYYDSYGCVKPPYNINHLCKLYDASSIHGSAIDAKVDNIVGLGFYLENTQKTEKMRDKSKSNKEKLKRQDDLIKKAEKDIIDYLDSLNVDSFFEEAISNFVKDYLVSGNGYLEIGRDINGNIRYLGHIPCRNIRIRRRRDGFIQVVDDRAIFFRNFGAKDPDPINDDVNPNEIIHLKRYNPNSDYYGVPDIVSADMAIAGNQFAQQYNIDYFENKAVPRYIIKLKGVKLGPGQQEKIFEFLGNTTKGVSHRSIVIPIPALDNRDIEFVPVETGKQEASFDDYVKLNADLILSRHRVPKNRIALDSGGSLASARDSDKVFKDSVCKPIQKILEKKINLVLKELTDMFTFKIKEYALTDEEQQSQIDEKYLRWGVYLPDEVRTKKGLSSRPDGKGNEPLDMLSLEKTSSSQQKAQEKSNSYSTRTRDQDREGSGVDSSTSNEGRGTKGEGRQTK